LLQLSEDLVDRDEIGWIFAQERAKRSLIFSTVDATEKSQWKGFQITCWLFRQTRTKDLITHEEFNSALA
jgi:hypothetical protein